MLNKILLAIQKLKDEMQAVKSSVKDGTDGQDGADGATVEDVLALVPTPQNGRDGRDGADGKDGRDGATVSEVLALVPKPKDGVDGVTPDINKVAALVPLAEDGKSGKDGRNGKDGKPGADGKDGKDGQGVTDVKLQNNDLFVFLNGRKKKAGTIKMPAVTAPFRPGDDGGGGGRSKPPRLDGLGWDPSYVPYKAVKKNTAVYDAGWLMASNKNTEERAAVQPQGAAFFLYDGTLTPNEVSAKQIIFGTRYTITQGGYINGYRVDVTAGQFYDVYLVRDPLGTPIVENLTSFTAGSTLFQTINIPPFLVLPGAQFDLVAVTYLPEEAPAVTPITYNYRAPNNDTAPTSGQIVQANKTLSQMRISKTDDGGGDQSAFLATLTVGSRISAQGVTWVIQAILDEGTFITATVSPELQATSQGVTQFGFEVVALQVLDYGSDVGHWATSPDVSGLLSIDGAYGDIVPDDNAYGTDILVQNALASEDWDLMAFSDSAGGPPGPFNVHREALGLFPTMVDQNPTGLGDAGKIRVNYGVGGDTANGEVTVDSDGTINCNFSGVEFIFSMTLRVGRVTSAGLAIILGRVLYAPDGIEANAVQLGDTAVIEIDDQDTITRQPFEFRLSMAVGSKLWLELARDEAGINQGGLITNQPTGTLAGWGGSNTVRLNISKSVTF